jgi:hypothetical protein
VPTTVVTGSDFEMTEDTRKSEASTFTRRFVVGPTWKVGYLLSLRLLFQPLEGS